MLKVRPWLGPAPKIQTKIGVFKERSKLRKIIAGFTIAISAFALVGCSSSANDAASMFETLKSSCGAFKSGSDVKKVTVSSELSKAPTVSFMTPLDSSKPKIQTNVIVEGKGPKITGGQYVSWEYAVFSGVDKSEITSTKFDGTGTQLQMIPATGDLCTALAGVREGSRVSLLVPSEIAGTSATGTMAAQVWIFDIKKVFLPHAVGDVQAPANGMPIVNRATDGKPAVSIPKTAAPTKFSSSVLIQGKGSAVKLGDKVVVHYSGYLWNGTTFDSSWESGNPASFTVDNSHLIKGFVKTLVGQRVGSQVIGVIPPSLGYGATANGSIPANSTLVFVVDILGIQ